MKVKEITKRRNSIKEEMLTKQKGITLIALVVTIIILLILAGVAINAAIGENGLFSKTRESVERHKEEAAKEKISMSIGEFLLDINSREMTEEEKDNHLKELLGKLGPTSVATDSSYYETEIDGYLFWVNKETLEIESKGTATEVKPETITVNETEIEIIVGHTEIIDMTVTPQEASGKYIKYTSSNEEAATVKNGTITGVGKGTAIITIESTENSSIKATITVTVKEVEAEGISIQPETLGLKVGETSEELQVTFTPWDTADKTITWSTDNASVATVDSDGKVTGVSAGTATITATTSNEKTATCEVTVSEIEVESISLEPNEITVNIGETSTETIQVTYNPTNAVNKTVTWESDNEDVATVSNGFVTGVSVGTVTVTATTPNGKTAECTVTVVDPEAPSKRAGDITITPKYDYGKVVTGYNSKTSGITWRLWYVDNVDENDKTQDTIYLIGDFITTAQAPTKTVNGTTYTVNGGKNDKCSYFTNILPAYTHNSSTNNIGNASKWIWDNNQAIASKWLSQWYNYNDGSHKTTGDNLNMKAVAYMMDSAIWTASFGDTSNKADYVIGGPTIEMYCASYKDSHPKKHLESRVNNDTGYEVAWNDNGIIGEYSYTQYGVSTSGNSQIYTPGSKDDPQGMWVSYPSPDNGKSLVCSYYSGSMASRYCDGTDFGFRPIVCLSTGTKIVANGTGFSIQ